MTTYLPPIERPRGLLLKLVYFFTRRHYGKVSRLDKKLRLPARTAVIIREQVASINMCLFCMDASRWYAIKMSPDNEARFDALAEYRTSPLFTDAERAALDYVSELASNKEVDPDTFARLS